jgi:hypothetical protein
MAVDLNVLVRHEGALFVCNPYSHTHHWCGLHRDTHTDRPASYRDVFMTLSAANTEIMDMLAAEYTPQELKDVAATLGYSEKEIAEYQRQEDAGELDPHENYFKTFLIAEIACAVIQHKGAVDIPGIVAATESQLPEFEEWYLSEARRIFGEMAEVEKTVTNGSIRSNARWRDLYAGDEGFQRQAELLSQVQARLGRYTVEPEKDTPPWEDASAAD